MTDIHARFDLQLADFALKVNLQLPGRGITAVFGPSGSGKTTLLRCMAGLEMASNGLLRVGGEAWQEGSTFVPTYQRRFGYVFQEASLFPHLSVRDNLEYGLRRIAPEARKLKLEQVVGWLGLQSLLNRKDTMNLSGGEQQRVAIGRALLTSPSLLLMDEPLSALDITSKHEILPYLERLHSELEIPVIYVSHALDEVARLADYIVLLDKGSVIASGALSETLARLDLPLAHLDDAGVVIDAAIAEHDVAYHLTRLDFSGGSLWVSKLDHAMGNRVRVRVLARDVSVATMRPQHSSITNILLSRIVEIQDAGRDKVNLRMEVGDAQALLARITRRSCDQLGLAVGMEVYAQVKSVVLVA